MDQTEFMESTDAIVMRMLHEIRCDAADRMPFAFGRGLSSLIARCYSDAYLEAMERVADGWRLELEQLGRGIRVTPASVASELGWRKK